MKSQSISFYHFFSLFALAFVAVQLTVILPINAKSVNSSREAFIQAEDPFNHVKQIKAGELNVGYVEAGPVNGQPVLLIHGWPYDIYSYKEVSEILAAKGYRVLIPYLRGFGTTRFLSDTTVRNGQQSVFAVDLIAFLDALKIKNAIVGGFDWGARTADIMTALWPERVKGLVSVSGYLIGSQIANKAPLKPQAELAWWYQFYFATDRGQAGYEANTAEFNKLIWQTASPTWKFSDETYNRSASSFNNLDHVKIVVDNYRWRLGITKGAQKYDAIESKLAAMPAITVPTITLEGDANGAPHPDPSSYALRFKGKYSHYTINGGVGHNLPQEVPQAFANAILEVAAWVR
jgi:pimeloyl-ACP methyl ester carboxylesterase